ncbi:hypothetical protein Poli38472_001935 [Pythium oligandrum]|uniref:Uncharacterized protein n=1 Tax=Pythium oligandrum TaxID=41045 RepID=A0A8K1FQT9_PYTOL|nr:hypothetical protein Poli38472_001935 [Pythium oligandrum]|eukprot:TMW69779.1 hypothetical protein Poli38472_001935 [Pythium oligandrum]
MEVFWVLPSGPLSTDEMAGWVSVEDENEIPLGYCLSENLAPIPCQSSFFSFGVLSNNGTNSSGYANGETKDGHVSRVTNFSTAVLHRYSMKGAEMLISNKNRDAYWSVNSTTGRLTVVKQDKASLFRMYKLVGGQGPVLLKTGSFYLALGDSGMYGSQVITSEHMLFPAQPTYGDPVGIVDALDAEIMGSRFQSLSNGGELYPVWMAYDLALVIPLRDLPEAPDFVDFTMENATAFDLIPMFTKFFHLVANRMVKAYNHYPSLAPSYPGDLAFINITRLMDGYPTSFRLPSDNVTWLVDHGWLANVEQAKQVTFVKAFRLFLPPRFAHYDKEPASVELVVKSHSLSDLGPARNGKKYEIPRVQYKTEYTYGAWHETPQLYERVVYHECNANLPPYCVRSRGIAQTNTDILPSLFSEWEVTAQLNRNASSIRIGYRHAVTPLLLHAQVELEHVVDQPGPVASLIDTSALPASRRELADDQVACCAEKDEYHARLGSSAVCLPCPAGSISQLGGLYCVVDPRVGG